ncbi:MAG: right-handed parallel beta-helix repeat-containing protein [Opitutaceae bacterium]
MNLPALLRLLPLALATSALAQTAPASAVVTHTDVGNARAISHGAGADSAVILYVSPRGDDANEGTVDRPLATPTGARDRARRIIAQGLTAPLEIVFGGGTYRSGVPLELRPEDSGFGAFPVTWKAAPGARVIWCAGREIPHQWSRGEAGVWQIDLSGIGPTSWNFRQLFVDGRRATRARFPNVDASNPFLYAKGGDLDHAIIAPALVKEAWGRARDAQLNLVPQWRFFNQWNTVTKVDPSTGRIDFADSERHAKVIPGNWFWIEGVREELDQPGEWFLDPESLRLSFMPPPGVDPNTLEIVAPALTRLVTARGDVNAGTHVTNVHFEGIEFRHTDFTLGHIEPRVHTDAAILFENTLDCSVRSCRFENIGGYALWLHLDSRGNRFDRNTVRHSGGGGVLLTGARLSYMDDSKIYTPGEAAAKVAPILNEITRNTVEHCGRIRYYGGGVHLDSRPASMAMSPGNLIAHNTFNDLSRNGVFAFRNQGGSVVEYNHIHNAMQTTIDGACIHFATMSHLNAPNFILNNWLYDVWGFEQKPDGKPIRRLGNGIFLDWDTSNTTVRDNWIYNSVGGAIKPIWQNQNLVIERNRESNERIVPPFVAELGPEGTATNGIPLAANRLTGSVVHYTDAPRVRTDGTWAPQTVSGMWGLFRFNFLVGTAAIPSSAAYSLPIPEDGMYELSLLYQPGADRASNVPVHIVHADGESTRTWNMREGSPHGFSVPVGSYRFTAAKGGTVTLSTVGTDGKVIADAVAFVKVGP